MPAPERHQQPTVPAERKSTSGVNAHLIGVAGVLVVLLLGILLLTENGWLERASKEVQESSPSLPSLDRIVTVAANGFADLVDFVVSKMKGASEMTTRSLEQQQGGADADSPSSPRREPGGGSSNAPANRHAER